MPLSGVVRAIPVLLKEFGDSWHFLANMVRVARSDHRRESGADRDPPGDERGATRGATRLAIPIREARTLCCQPVEIRCRCTARNAATIAAEVAPADVVGHDNDNVRFLACRA